MGLSRDRARYMPVSIDVTWDKRGIAALETGPFKRSVVRALRKAGSTALRDMRSAASKRIRQRKRIKPSYIARALTLRRAKGSDIATMSWAVEV